MGGPPSIGGLSPSGTRLVTLYDADNRTCISVWDARKGQLQARLRVNPINPLDIIFASESKFYLQSNTHRVAYVVSPAKVEDQPFSLLNIFSTFNVVSPVEMEDRSHSLREISAFDGFSSVLPGNPITHPGPLPRIRYNVDATREWVVCGSKRICWVPPGYIGSVQPNHWWIDEGRSLVMLGQFGELKKLVFRESLG